MACPQLLVLALWVLNIGPAVEPVFLAEIQLHEVLVQDKAPLLKRVG